MATISFNILDAHLPRIVEAFTVRYDYVDNALSGESQAQFTRRVILEHIRDITLKYEDERDRKLAIADWESTWAPSLTGAPPVDIT